MPELAWPWVLLALPLPWLAMRWLPPAHGQGAALRMPGLAAWSDRARSVRRRGSGRIPILLWAAWLLFCLAASRPQWLGEPVQPPQSGRDLLLAVDLSGSMAEQDMRLGGRRVDRLTAVKAVLGDFLERRQGDRVGLLLFGRQAYVITPLTPDRQSVRQQLDDSVIGMAGRETAIGDAVALAVKRLRERAGDPEASGQPASQRVLILLTDGVNTAGVIDPDRALELARGEGVRIYTVGFGGGGGGGGGLFGLGSGNEIDEAMLNRLAAETGGRYFRAMNTAELAGIYSEIDAIEPVDQAALPVRPRHDLYPWPLASALMILLAWTILQAGPAWRERRA